MTLRRTLLGLALIVAVSLPVAAQAQTASVYVIHGISGGSLGLADFGFPVDISIGDLGCAITGLTFTGIIGPVALEPGDYAINIYPATKGGATCKGTPAISATVSVKRDRSYSVVAFLDETGAPTAGMFRNTAAEDRVALQARSTASVTVRHTAAAPMVDTLVKKGNSVTALGPFGSGEQLGPVDLGKGSYGLGLGLPGTQEPVFGYFDQRFTQGVAYYVYAFGGVANGTLAFVVHSIR